ncbi:Glycyl-tRNA synthetase beta subunit [Cycloclasticus sp. P1]|nr:Glycyl-tRNA synthetase beta subunit [Cycloclasticus sp. P1]
MLDRLKGYCLSNHYSPEQFVSVASVDCTRPVDFMNRIRAVKDFSKLDEAMSLTEANKRIQNLLKKAPDNVSALFDASRLVDQQEIYLYEQLQLIETQTQPLIEQQQYIEALKVLSKLKTPIDDFFEHVFIMAEDEQLKHSRLALLNKIHSNFIKIADISIC